MEIAEILKMLASAVVGVVIAWVFAVRGRWRKYGGADFDLVSRTVTQAIADLEELSGRIGTLEKEKVLILNRLTELERENAKLKKENQHLEEVLRAYIKEKNPNIAK